MDSERWRKIVELYEAAQERAQGERGAFLADACPGDDELMCKVEAMLAQDSESNILDGPVSNLLVESEAAASLSAGDRLGPYEIVGPVGAGGMGEVYRARDPRLQRNVAIKVLPAEVRRDPSRRQRFEREARAVAALNHPNIVAIYDVGEDRGMYFIVNELVEGAPLRTAELSVGRALGIAVQIASGLAVAHQSGVVHRDLKPENIMITGKGLVKVLDFGLAMLTHPAAGTSASGTTVTMQSAEGTIIGTTAYMSPEQAQGLPLDARTDIFSFGILLYEMLTGRRPFAGDTQLSTLAAIVNQEPTAVKKIVEKVPVELDRIVGRCLRKDPARRFQNMTDLYVALEELKVQSDAAWHTGSVSSVRLRKRAWSWTGSVVLAVAAFGVWHFKRSATPAAQPKILPLTTDAGFQFQPSLSPDGNQVAFSSGGEKDGYRNIFVKMIGETHALRLTDDPSNDEYPAWSPDGKRIAFERFGRNRGIYTVSPLGGAVQKLTDLWTYGQMSWTPDGKWLAAASRRSATRGIFLLPVDGGEPRRISEREAPVFDLAPSVSHDGRMLAYANCTGSTGVSDVYSCDVYIQGLDSAYALRGDPRRISSEPLTEVNSMAWSVDGKSLIADGAQGAADLTYLWRMGIHGGHPAQRIELAGAKASYPAISSMGKHLAFQRVLENFDIWRYHVGGGMEPVIVPSMREVSAQFSPDGTRIAFDSNRSGEANEIWVARADGSGATQMTNRLGRHQGTPRWCPDGRWIAFDSQRQDGRWDIYVIDANGGTPRRIVYGPSDVNLPSWSHDGKWLYYRLGGSRFEIWRIRLAGGSPERVTADGGDTTFESVDGKTLFYMKGRFSPLFARLLSGGPERQILPWVQGRAFFPTENGIYYIGQRGGDQKWPLEFFQFSSQTSRVLTKIDGFVSMGLSVSPDRRTILFSRSAVAGVNLMMIENFQ